MERFKDTVGKRSSAVTKVMEVIRKSPLFTERGKRKVMSFNGDVLTDGKQEDMMKAHEDAKVIWRRIVKSQ